MHMCVYVHTYNCECVCIWVCMYRSMLYSSPKPHLKDQNIL